MKTNTHIVVTGASGFIGSALVSFFHEQGYTVSALLRTPPASPIHGVEYVHYDMSQMPDSRLFHPETVLIHCAYSKTRSSSEEDSNITATTNLLKLAKQNGVKQCLFLSSLSAGSDSGTYYARQKYLLETLFIRQNGTVLRPGLVIGKGGLFYQTVQTIRKTRLLPIINGGRQPVYYIGIHDLVKITGALILNQKTGIFYALNQPAIPFKTFYKTIAKHLSMPIRIIPVPLWFLKLMALAYKVLPGEAKITSDNIKGLQHVPVPDPVILKASTYNFPFESLEMSLRDLH